MEPLFEDMDEQRHVTVALAALFTHAIISGWQSSERMFTREPIDDGFYLAREFVKHALAFYNESPQPDKPQQATDLAGRIIPP
jgi:hypothetical protein